MKSDDWILVDDKLPEHDQDVITYFGGDAFLNASNL